MTTSKVGAFNFIKWIGPPPVIVSEQGTTFHRPGTDGTGQQTIGRWSDPFIVTLIHWESTYLRALRNAALMSTTLPRSGPIIVAYEGIRYHLPPFRTLYHVDSLSIVKCQKLARQYGSGINYQNGGEVVVEMTFTPLPLY